MSLTTVLRIRVYAEVCFWYVEDEQNTRIIEKFAFSFLRGSSCLLMTSSCFQLKMNMKIADVASLSHINLHCYLNLNQFSPPWYIMASYCEYMSTFCKLLIPYGSTQILSIQGQHKRLKNSLPYWDDFTLAWSKFTLSNQRRNFI